MLSIVHQQNTKIQFLTGVMMRNFFLLISFFSFTLPAKAYDMQGLMDAFYSVVMIRGYNSNGGMAYGSGVVVGENKVITNCHVLRSTKQPWISRGEDSYAITGVRVDAWHDLCLVSAHQLPFKAAKLGNSTDLKRGQEVAGIGHSNGVPAPLTSRGYVKGLYPNSPGNVIRTSAKFLMGASGSGLFDMDGHLVGINTFKTAGTGGSIHFALPIEWLQTLEKQAEITTFPIEGKALWEEDEDKKPFYMQAAVPESREDWPKLAEVAEKWTVAEPKTAEAWYTLGVALENISKNDLAAKAFNQAFLLDGNNYDALVHMGLIAKSNGDSAEMHRIQVALANIDENLANEYVELLGCGKSC
jgi:serine protease Do